LLEAVNALIRENAGTSDEVVVLRDQLVEGRRSWEARVDHLAGFLKDPPPIPGDELWIREHSDLELLGLLAVWIPLSPALEGAYGLTAADLATSGVFFAAAFAIGELAAGPIADGYGRRPVLLVGLAVLAVATVVVAASPTWPVYLAARVGQGAAAGTFAPVALTWVSEALPAQRRTLGLEIVVTAYQASAITGQLYGQVVGEAIGWRWVCLLLAVFYVLVTVILVRRLYEPRQRVPGETDAWRWFEASSSSSESVCSWRRGCSGRCCWLPEVFADVPRRPMAR
jgi:MFS family permease